MKNSLYVLGMLTVLGCTKPHPPATTEFPTVLNLNNDDWVVYEGILPSRTGDSVFTELSLQTAAPGIDSRYQMKQTVTTPGYSFGTVSNGAYRVLSGGADIYVIQLLDKQPLTRLFLDKQPLKGLQRGTNMLQFDEPPTDLFFRNIGKHRLLLVDENFQSSAHDYILHRRSDLFTVEGYLTVYPDTVEFYERNTQKKWAVARFGYYHEAVKKYHLLAKQKHEGIYLKALSYSTPHIDSKGRDIDALVFKTILDMDTVEVVP